MYPNKLKKGDLVRIIAPSSSLGLISGDVREIANERFEKLGLKLSFGKHVEEMDMFRSSSIESRVEDLHDAFSDQDVKAVIVVIGGYNCNQLLKYINWDIIKNNPKIFCGFSDITALNNAIYAKTGLVNYSGPAYSTFGKALDMEYTAEYFQKCLFLDEQFEILPSKRWDDRKWWENQEDREYFPNVGWWIINKGKAEGTLLGANLCTFNLLQGTEFMPDLKDSILFLEEDAYAGEKTDIEFDRNLQSVIQQINFDSVKGLVIGRFQKSSLITKEKVYKIVRTKKELVNLPILANVDFGHTDPKITFPIGGEVSLDVKYDLAKIIIKKH